MGDASGVIFARLFLTDPQWVFWIEIENAVVFDIDLGDAVVGGGKQEVVVEADFARTGFVFAVPDRALAFLVQAEVPLADDGGGAAGARGKGD